jgi:4'-phosphopantetheinyl transferase
MMLDLAPGQVHIWTIALDQPREMFTNLEKTLSDDERQRAARFVVDIPRQRFINGRGALRRLVGQYLNIQPEAVKFTFNPFGKPLLAPELGQDSLQFNLTHSKGLILAAFTRHARIGVDVEWREEMQDALEIAARFFTPAECRVIRAADQDLRTQTFLRYWTCKEAFIKAVGEGISYPLDEFEIEFEQDGPKIRFLGKRETAPGAWTMQFFSPAGGYSAALAVEGEKFIVQYFTFPDKR